MFVPPVFMEGFGIPPKTTYHFSCFPSLLQQQFAQQEVTQIVGSKTHFVASPQNTGNPRNPAENLEIGWSLWWCILRIVGRCRILSHPRCDGRFPCFLRDKMCVLLVKKNSTLCRWPCTLRRKLLPVWTWEFTTFSQQLTSDHCWQKGAKGAEASKNTKLSCWFLLIRN